MDDADGMYVLAESVNGKKKNCKNCETEKECKGKCAKDAGEAEGVKMLVPKGESGKCRVKE